MTQTIDIKLGIYDTWYTLIEHDDGTISIKYPWLKERNNGEIVLVHGTKVIDSDEVADVRAFFDAGELVLDANNNCGALTLDDVLHGNRYPGVHVIHNV